MMPSFVRCISGAWMLRRCVPSTPALVARFAIRSNASMYSGPAVGIAAVVERVHADEDVARAEHLGPRQRERQEDRVARRHVRDRDARAHLAIRAVLRHVDVRGQRRAAEDAQVDLRDDMLATPAAPRSAAPRELRRVPLPVAEAQRVRREALALRDRQHRRRVEAPAQEDDCVLAAHRPSEYGVRGYRPVEVANGRRPIWRVVAVCFALLAPALTCATSAAQPGTEWQKVAPAAVGLDAAKLNEIAARARGAGRTAWSSCGTASSRASGTSAAPGRTPRRTSSR